MTLAGTNRYSTLESFTNEAQGNVDFSAWGAAYAERGPQALWQGTPAHMPTAPGDGNFTAANALGTALDTSRYQGGYLNGAGLAPWQSASARSGWESQIDYANLGSEAYEQACFLAGTPLLTPNGAKPIEQFRVGLEGTDPEGYACCCEAIAGMDQRADLAAVTAPTLVIAGADDPATPPEHGAVIAAGIDGAILEVIPDSAHLAAVSAPEAVTDALQDHLSAAAAGDAIWRDGR